MRSGTCRRRFPIGASLAEDHQIGMEFAVCLG